MIFIGPPPMADAAQNARTRSLSLAFESVARAEGVPYLPVFDRLLDDQVWMDDVAENDGSHPGRKGYERLAALVMQWEHWWFR